jgi:hypothetical protein
VNAAFDHAVIAVPDLDDASRRFTDAGFTVVRGGRHDVIPTVNALIVFEDGGYLELLAPRDAEARESLRVRAARKAWARSCGARTRWRGASCPTSSVHPASRTSCFAPTTSCERRAR